MDNNVQPFYSIAHRVLTVQGVVDALTHGANAIEVDLTAWDDGWWADHSSRKTPASRGDTAYDIFSTIALQRQAGRVVTFVWFDIKTPDKYPSTSASSKSTFDALRALGQELLAPHGIRVLYGFCELADSAALSSLNGTLTPNEAVSLDGSVQESLNVFDTIGISNRAQRVLSRGLFDLNAPGIATQVMKIVIPGVGVDFGVVCDTLKMGKQSGRFGKVFGWTVLAGNYHHVDQLLYEARVDGLIHGFMNASYYDHPETRAAAQSVRNWIETNPGKYRLAGQDDPPW